MGLAYKNVKMERDKRRESDRNKQLPALKNARLQQRLGILDEPTQPIPTIPLDMQSLL